MVDGATVRVATVGREGMIPLPEVFGTEGCVRSALVQAPGAAWVAIGRM